MPTIPIVDGHLHLWDTGHGWYPQLAQFAAGAGKPELADNFLLADYERAAGSTAVAGLVHVSATTAPHAYLAETRWVTELAGQANRPVAIIGSVDPALPTAELADHLEQQSRSPHFRGIRVYRRLAPNTPAAETIAAWLQERDAVFDLVTTPAETADWIDFLAGYPNLRVVLEHLGLPEGTGADERLAWQKSLTLAAKETDWRCKVSGLGMICPDLSWESLAFWLETTADLWGWRRLLFGSNMPVDTMAGSYAELLETIDRMVAADATDQEAEFFYAANAAETYSLR
ncbi:amidohydrolase family protein [Nocardia huaxiensis]|uniref:Amidohydrolase family protein n=1 Tax=Nocardia huaxiensis TaxID=2755382 RepID=A0A7D6Z8L9_9NOCA|nr:amidohydrolase family protein [Nocardia huaxiensis]QLY27698.1 amidohydrolase family protein [Nocardia huaxiensis]UFS98913.1 amidohydrolase family protein [Nocardia huaxiensis]